MTAKKKLLHAGGLLIVCLIFSTTIFAQQSSYKKIDDGVIVTFKNKNLSTRLLRLQVVTPGIIHVLASPADSFVLEPNLMITRKQTQQTGWTIHQQGDDLMLSTTQLTAKVNMNNGAICFIKNDGSILLGEKPTDGRCFIPETIDGTKGYKIRQVFIDSSDDALYGLGENQLGLTNIKDQDIVLAQHNTEAFVPFFLSTKNYGVLWDNYSIIRFGNPQLYQPISGLYLYNQNGQPVGLTATYISSEGGKEDSITRPENTINYGDLDALDNLPEGFLMADHSSVEWKGFIASPYEGLHHFLIHSGGYIKIWIGGKLLVNKWRQCWNPSSTLLEFPMAKNKKYAIKIKWIPDGEQSFLDMKWRKPLSEDEKNEISLASEMGKNINYYFIAGNDPDQVIGGYRQLTGKAPVMPIWAYGFWQSREHYDSQKQILDIVREFRERKIPLDNIVQDWFYWKKDQWGTQEFDSSRYPDPSGMIDTLHDEYHAHFMISVWPKFYTGTKIFKTFWDKGWLYKKNVEDHQKDWVGYVSTFYDAFNPVARKAFWNLVNKKLFNLGVDAWWLDASEPDIYSNTSITERKQLMNPTALGPSTEYFNAYPLVNEEGFYNGQRSVKPNQRVFILTRSAYAGSQRYAAATWSGDIGATWQDMKNQIATGISFSMSGIPYWTMDIGGFAAETRYQHLDSADLAEWREQLTRWYQFGAFCPIFRVHGQAPYRELFNVAPENSEAYQTMLYYDQLHYRLLPYIYSLGGAVYLNNYTIMRGLVMDFENDTIARNITDEYMFGPDLLISPVYAFKARSRKVYLPAGAGWYNLYDGKYLTGGQFIEAAAPYTRMPVFVKAGAIIPFGPSLQYTEQKPADTITLYVFSGTNGSFNLYEDDGVDYNYEKGAFSIIPLSFNEQTKTLTIGKRKGLFEGMLQQRFFNIVWISPDHAATLNFNNKPGAVIHYDGNPVSVTMK
jgi:alpha-D-xyloside xylohydrolase